MKGQSFLYHRESYQLHRESICSGKKGKVIDKRFFSLQIRIIVQIIICGSIFFEKLSLTVYVYLFLNIEYLRVKSTWVRPNYVWYTGAVLDGCTFGNWISWELVLAKFGLINLGSGEKFSPLGNLYHRPLCKALLINLRTNKNIRVIKKIMRREKDVSINPKRVQIFEYQHEEKKNVGG